MASNRPSANMHQENSISKVLFFSELPSGCTSEDLSATCSMFGSVQHIQMLNRPGLGLVEMGNEGEAQALISFAQSKTLNVRNQRVQVAYAKQRELNRSFDYSSSNPQSSGSGRVALLTIRNARSPITVSVLKEILRPFGQLMRVVIFEKNDNIMALVEMASPDQTRKVISSLKDREIYAGQSQISTSLSHIDTLVVRENSDRSRDFTNPNLPTRMSAGSGAGLPDRSNYHPNTHMQMAMPMMPNMSGVPGMNNVPMGHGHVYPTMAGAMGQGAGATPGTGGVPGTAPNSMFLGYPNMMGMMPVNAAMNHPMGHHAMNPAMNHMFVGTPYGAYPGMMPPTGGMTPGNLGPASDNAPYDAYGKLGTGRSFSHYRGPGTSNTPLSTPGTRAGPSGSHMHSHGPVVLIHNLPPALATPKHVFNLACVYGNVSRIRIVSRPKGVLVMAQMQTPAQAANLLSALPNAPIEGHSLSLTPSRHSSLSNDSGSQHSGQESIVFEDFSESTLRRFKDSGPARTPFRPSSSLYFAGLAPDVTEEQFRNVLVARGARPIHSITFLAPRESRGGSGAAGHGRKSGFIEFQSISDAMVTLMCANNLDDFDPHSIVRLSFSKDGSTQSSSAGSRHHHKSGTPSSDGPYSTPTRPRNSSGSQHSHSHPTEDGNNTNNPNNPNNADDNPNHKTNDSRVADGTTSASTRLDIENNPLDRKRQRSPMVDALGNPSTSTTPLSASPTRSHAPATDPNSATNTPSSATPATNNTPGASGNGSTQGDTEEDTHPEHENYRENKYLQESEQQLFSADLHELVGTDKADALQEAWGTSTAENSSEETNNLVETAAADRNVESMRPRGSSGEEHAVNATAVVTE